MGREEETTATGLRPDSVVILDTEAAAASTATSLFRNNAMDCNEAEFIHDETEGKRLMIEKLISSSHQTLSRQALGGAT